jgi:hypothetical protein
MQGIDATIDDVPLDGGRNNRQLLLKMVPGAVALTLIGSAGLWVHHSRQAAVPDVVVAPAAKPAAVPDADARLFGDIIVDPSFLAEMKQASPSQNASQLASLEAAPPAPAAVPQPEILPPAPSASIPLPEKVPLPPKRDVPQIVDSAPLPPPRPAEFGAPAAPERNPAQQSAKAASPAAPADSRSFFDKVFGLFHPSGPAVAGKTPEGRLASIAPQPRATFAAPEGRLPGLAAIFGGSGSPIAGYDRYTAIYDISARTVYLPDGTRLEAHSGYGDRLDDPRYVNERMYGPTPPNVYELTPREASFHGVQALRLNPIGDSPLYGRAGLLAHSYMLGPNGDSNGCVSFKDYEAFLRAYRNGQVRKLVVVARL